MAWAKHSRGSGDYRTKPGLLRSLAFGMLCFFAPIVILILVSAWNGVYPFGEESFLSEDLRFQYCDFYAWFIQILNGQASLFYNPFTGMGTNAWGIYSYYLGSPVNLLLPLFGEDRITLFVYVTTAFKLGCMGVTTAWYVRHRFRLAYSPVLALSLCYVWSTWTATQMRNPQWLDALVILPLMAWAVFVLVRDDRWVPLVASIAAAVITCWYSAYMLLAYLFLLYVLEMIAWVGWKSMRGKLALGMVLRRTGRLLACIVTGLCISAWTFLPTLLQMLDANMPATASLPVDNGFSPLIMGSLLFGWTSNYTPQVFAGTALIVLVAAAPFMRAIPLRVRVSGIASVLFLAYGTVNEHLQLAWSGFRPTMGFYCRMSWLIVFSMLWLAAWVLCAVLMDRKERKGGSKVSLALGAMVTMALVLFARAFLGYEHRIGMAMMVCGALLVVIATLLLGSGQRWLRTGAGVLLCLFVGGELLCSAHICWETNYVGYLESYHQAYWRESRMQLMDLREHDPGLYRVDKTYTRLWAAALNEGMSKGYLALSSYCSSQNGDAVSFLSRIGYSPEGEFSVRYSEAMPVMDSLLGVKYVSTRILPAGYEDPGLMPVKGWAAFDGNASVSDDQLSRFYQNPHALALAYGVSDDIVGAGLREGNDVFAEQNALVSRMLGREEPLYVPLDATPVDDVASTSMSGYPDAGGDVETYIWDVTVPAGTIGYVRSAPSDTVTTLQIDDRAYSENDRWLHAVTELADAREGVQTVRVELSGEGMHSKPAQDTCYFYGLDWDVYERVMDELAAHEATVGVFDAGHVLLEYQADEDGWMFVSMPYEAGWSAKVNGVAEQLSEAYDNAFMLVPVKAGLNRVELSFVSPGFLLGCVISALTVMCCMIAVLRQSKHRDRCRMTTKGAHSLRAKH